MSDKIKATLPEALKSNGRNHGDKKELVSTWSVSALTTDENGQPKIAEIIDARCWMGRSASASTVYASIWIHTRDKYGAGNGSAGGYGYHKESAAIASAIDSAGIELSRPINGVGESAVREALEAIARELGFAIFNVVSH